MLRCRSLALLILLACLGCNGKPIEHPSTVYVLKGWTGNLSPGLDQLVQDLNAADINAGLYEHNQWKRIATAIESSQPSDQPVVLVGHSYGADDAIRVARKLNDRGIEVDLLIGLEANSPPTVPGNVKRCVNFYRSNGAWDAVPIFRGVPMKSEPDSTGELVNIDLRGQEDVDHFTITKNPWTQKVVMDEILKTCGRSGSAAPD